MARCRIGAWAVVAVATVRVAGSAGVDGCETSFWQIGAEGQTCEAACRLVQPPGTAICKNEALEAWAPLTSGETVAETFKLSDETCGKVYERDSAAAPMIMTGSDTCVGRTPGAPADCLAEVPGKMRRLCSCCDAEWAYPPTQSPSYAPTPAKPKPTPPPNTPRPTPAHTPAPTTECSRVSWDLGEAGASCAAVCGARGERCLDGELWKRRAAVDELREVEALVAAAGGGACSGGWVNANPAAPYVNALNGHCFARSPTELGEKHAYGAANGRNGFCALRAPSHARLCPCCTAGVPLPPSPAPSARPTWPELEAPADEEERKKKTVSPGALAGGTFFALSFLVFAIYKLLKMHENPDSGLMKPKYRRRSFTSASRPSFAPTTAGAAASPAPRGSFADSDVKAAIRASMQASPAEDRRRTGINVIIDDAEDDEPPSVDYTDSGLM